MVLRTTILLVALALFPATSHATAGSEEPHLADIRQLTFGGENAEAYFSFAGDRLVFQATHAPDQCDQIFTMNLDGSDVRRLHPSG
jgi:Tol biopolymer transport system component